MKQSAIILIIAALCTVNVFAGESSSPDPNEIVARIFDKKIARREIEPSEELHQQQEKLFPNQKWSDLVIQYRNNNLGSLIGKPLMEQFVKEQNIQVTEKDLDEFADAMMASVSKAKAMDERLIKEKEDQLRQEGLTQEKKQELGRSIDLLKRSLSAGDAGRSGFRNVGKTVIEMWKFNQALYKIYGGRVIWQQAGIEPLDAYKQFLEGHEKRGDFEILDKDLRDGFWAYWTTMRHTEIPKDKVDFATPWWLKAKEQVDTGK